MELVSRSGNVAFLVNRLKIVYTTG